MERILEQIIKGIKCVEERKNLISKLSLTLKVAIESIRSYKANMKDDTHYKNASGISIPRGNSKKDKRQCTRYGKCHATLLTKSVEDATAYIILTTIVSQRHTYDKRETIAQRKWEKEARTNFTACMILKKKQENVNAAYRTETEAEQE